MDKGLRFAFFDCDGCIVNIIDVMVMPTYSAAFDFLSINLLPESACRVQVSELEGSKTGTKLLDIAY